MKAKSVPAAKPSTTAFMVTDVPSGTVFSDSSQEAETMRRYVRVRVSPSPASTSTPVMSAGVAPDGDSHPEGVRKLIVYVPTGTTGEAPLSCQSVSWSLLVAFHCAPSSTALAGRMATLIVPATTENRIVFSLLSSSLSTFRPLVSISAVSQ